MMAKPNEKETCPVWAEAIGHARRMLAILEGDIMNGRQPTCVDPCKKPDEVYQEVRAGRLDVYCDRCGMLGNSGNWRTVQLTNGGDYLKQCPNCSETQVKALRETPGSGATGTQGTIR